MCIIVRERRREKFVCVCVLTCVLFRVCVRKRLERLGIQYCLVCAIGVVDIYTFEAQTIHLCMQDTNYANDLFRLRE